MSRADPGGSQGSILVVDDTPAYVRILTKLLSRHGYRVHAAGGAEPALLLAASALPDLILLDVKMPVMGGYALCERLKADVRTRDITVIFISGADHVDDKVQAFACGGVDYIAKPFHDAEVLARVRTHLALRSLQKRLEEHVRERTAELVDSRERLRELAAHHDAVRENERKRIAGEIHDELGSLLTALKMDISLLRMGVADGADIQGRVEHMHELAEQTIHMVRHVATQLRPTALNLGIVPALEWLVEDFGRRAGVPCTVDADGEIEMDDAQATAIFRIVQESLTNVARHAAATEVEVRLARNAAGIELAIKDNGCGFDPATAGRDSFGLLGIRERALLLGATTAIDSAPGKGTTVAIAIPCTLAKS